ncbi:MAG: hypothetical protein QOH70_4024 [Blastocatellia bacterium]|nr:hypothetical protein [Blastocatellia bacterium]
MEFESKDYLLLSPSITLPKSGEATLHATVSLQAAFQQQRELAEGAANYADVAKFIKTIVQHELLREGQSAQAFELAYRVALLENKLEKLSMPDVQYVHVLHDAAWEPLAWESLPESAETLNVISISKFPRAVIVFYSLGLICTLVFAVLIALSALGTNLIHPFLSLLGFVGGLGWLTTAWTDLLLWKRERCLDPSTSTNKADNTARIVAA